jgi:hypothetical protein
MKWRHGRFKLMFLLSKTKVQMCVPKDIQLGLDILLQQENVLSLKVFCVGGYGFIFFGLNRV